MFNLRYHIASLVGVFLALALGLVLGGLVVRGGAIDRQQGALVEGLQEEFAALRQENRELADENQLLGAYSTRITDEWASGKLAGRTILLVTNSGRVSGADDAAAAIESAGGRVATVVILKPGLGLDDGETRASVASLAPDPDEPLRSIAASLAAEWSAPSAARPLTEALVAAEVIRVDGLGDGVMAAGLIDVAVSDSTADAAGVALARAFGQSAPAAGAQSLADDTGVAEAARAAGVSAFDTLGTDVGRYTLIALMTGATPGYYGTADGVDALFPVQ